MRTDTRFNRPDRRTIEERLPSGVLGSAQALGIWDMMLRADDPAAVSHLYRSYRDSNRCTIPRQSLRHMRDVMITAMREANREDPKPRKERKTGGFY